MASTRSLDGGGVDVGRGVGVGSTGLGVKCNALAGRGSLKSSKLRSRTGSKEKNSVKLGRNVPHLGTNGNAALTFNTELSGKITDLWK